MWGYPELRPVTLGFPSNHNVEPARAAAMCATLKSRTPPTMERLLPSRAHICVQCRSCRALSAAVRNIAATVAAGPVMPTSKKAHCDRVYQETCHRMPVVIPKGSANCRHPNSIVILLHFARSVDAEPFYIPAVQSAGRQLCRLHGGPGYCQSSGNRLIRSGYACA